ncbi:NUDIX domain-containing protein [Aeromicrobium tamlense]|uniref:NUDIX domain-containing protein n=1 Tax=Aeromicrobium tamlense TaxID=375541 RepID=A0A8I0FVS7_9ACTN|nr:NUDIX domain-containing protein [Aeromicrobium tamlense]MBD1269740.1 NUDIX domain-containing protein [Aeromicrobium tamlense]NYI39604.1 nudix-type nucleoside diphosphatase (YffH/AdpP family) [Aeromicrobium tamlense]
MTAGIDTPDRRGRIGLHLTGRDLDRNPDVVVKDVEVLANDWYVLRATTFEQRMSDGTWRTERRETYDRGDGATILLYDADARTILLTRQFRFPVYVNGHPDGMLIETAAGLLDEDDAEAAIRREAAEETGIEVGPVQHVFDVFMSPGSVTERLHFFAAPYRSDDAHETRHGVAHEGEDIEIVELGIDEARAAIGTDIVDAKTIMLIQWALLDGPFA